MKKIVSLFLAVIMAMSVFANVVFADVYSWEGSYGYYNFDDEGNVIISNYAIKDEYEKFLEYVGEDYEVKSISLSWIGFVEGGVFAASSDTLEKVNFDVNVYEIGYNVFGENHNVSVSYEDNESLWNEIYKENSNDYFGDVSFCSNGNVLISGAGINAYGDKVFGGLHFYFVEEDCVAELCVYNENHELEVTYPIDVYAGSTAYDFSFDLESDGQYHEVEITLYNNLTERVKLLDTRYFGFYAEDVEFSYDYMNVNTDNYKVTLDLYFSYLATDVPAVVEIYDYDDNYNETLNTSYNYVIPAGTTHFSEVLPFEFDNKYHKLQVKIYEDATMQNELVSDYTTFYTEITDGSFFYEIIDDESVRLVKSLYPSYLQIIPDMLGNYKVTEVGENVFKDDVVLEELTVGKNITTIGNGAFDGCENLYIVYYPESEESWANINIGENNEELLNASIMCDYFEMSAWFNTNYGADDHQVYVSLNGCTRDCVVKIDVNNISANEVTTYYFDVEAGTTNVTFDVPLTCYDETVQIYGSVMSADKTTYYVIPRQFLYFTPYPQVEEFVEGIFSYCVVDGEAQILGFSDYEARRQESIVIPDTLGGYPVTTLWGWSLCETEAEEIVLGKNLKNIGYGALSYNFKLKNVVVGQNPYFVFENGVLYNKDKTELVVYCLTNEATHFDMPDTVKIIGPHSFEGHEHLKTITVSDNLKSIERQAFAYSSVGGELVLPEGLEAIGYEGLVAQFTKVYIPSTVTKIANDALYNYIGNLTDIIVDEDNQYFASLDGVLFNKDMTKLIRYPEAKKGSTYAIPDGVEELDMVAFDSVDIKTLYIPRTLKRVGEFSLAFERNYLLYEGTKSEFMKVFGRTISVDDMGLVFNAQKTGAKFGGFDARYFEDKLNIAADIDYIFDEGTAVVGVYDENGRMVHFKTFEVGLDTTNISCSFDADESCLDYTVKLMYWGKDGSVTPITDVVTKEVKTSVLVNQVIESDHPYVPGVSHYSYQHTEECDSIDVTFSEDTYVMRNNDTIEVFSYEGNFYKNFTGDELAGTTLRLPGTEFGIRLYGYSGNPDNDYGFKIEKIVANVK